MGEGAQTNAALREDNLRLRQALLVADARLHLLQQRAARAAERARASQRRREEAEAALERVRKRVAEREAAGKVAAPLPVPEAASASGR